MRARSSRARRIASAYVPEAYIAVWLISRTSMPSASMAARTGALKRSAQLSWASSGSGTAVSGRPTCSVERRRQPGRNPAQPVVVVPGQQVDAVPAAAADLVGDQVRDHQLAEVAQVDRAGRAEPGGAHDRRAGSAAIRLGDHLVGGTATRLHRPRSRSPGSSRRFGCGAGRRAQHLAYPVGDAGSHRGRIGSVRVEPPADLRTMPVGEAELARDELVVGSRATPAGHEDAGPVRRPDSPAPRGGSDRPAPPGRQLGQLVGKDRAAQQRGQAVAGETVAASCNQVLRQTSQPSAATCSVRSTSNTAQPGRPPPSASLVSAVVTVSSRCHSGR